MIILEVNGENYVNYYKIRSGNTDKKMSLNQLSALVEMTNVNLSNLKTGKMKGIRFETMNAICKALHCQPGDLFEYIEDEI